VAELGRPDGVAVDEDCGHAADGTRVRILDEPGIT
jgi:hypothetical protein